MAKIVWDKNGERLIEAGVDRAVLYDYKADGTYGSAVAWNGWTGFNENPEGGDANDLWADNIQYGSIRGAEKFGGTITAYTYPDEFKKCDGSLEIAPGVYAGQQNRKPFGLCYRSLIGSDTEGLDKGYIIHLVYGCTASPSGKDRSTTNENPDAIEFSWDIETTPVPLTTKINGVLPKPTAHLELYSTKMTAEKLAALEDKLYGSETTDGTLPLPDEIITLLSA